MLARWYVFTLLVRRSALIVGITEAFDYESITQLSAVSLRRRPAASLIAF
jgi:hypothetical protein